MKLNRQEPTNNLPKKKVDKYSISVLAILTVFILPIPAYGIAYEYFDNQKSGNEILIMWIQMIIGSQIITNVIPLAWIIRKEKVRNYARKNAWTLIRQYLLR